MVLGDKYLLGMVNITIPTTWWELQSLLGKLLWAQPFLPHYKTIVAPIEALLVERGEVKWTPQCLSALNELVQTVFLRLRI